MTTENNNQTHINIGRVHNTAYHDSAHVLLRTLTTVVQMLTDRGYSTIQSCQSIDEIREHMTETSHIIFATTPDIKVYFHNEDRVGVKQIRNWLEHAPNEKIIIISLEGPTTFTKKEVDQSYPGVEFFLFKDMSVNITKHKLVPQHTRLTTEEIAELKYTTADVHANFPSLYTTDRIAQYYGYCKGDVIRISRTAGVNELTPYYRLVRHPPTT